MKKIFTVLIVLGLFLGCTKAIYSQSVVKGVYILSEGGGSPGSATLSYIDYPADSFYVNIFSPGNIGLFPNGLIISGQELYMTEQGPFSSVGKIYKMNKSGTVISSMSIGTNPYSLAQADGKVYTTNGPGSSVSVINLDSLTEMKTIPVGEYPQEILAVNGKVFACNVSLFGGNQDSTVSVIDTQSDSVIYTIILKKDPSSIALSKDSTILVGCPGDSASGIIFEIDPDTYQKTDSFYIAGEGFGKDISVDVITGDIRFISDNNNIVKLDMTTDSVEVLITNPNPSAVFFYGYGYDYVNGKHYVADAGNFVSTGKLYVYDNGGSLESTYNTGVAPRRIVIDIDNSVYVSNGAETVENFTLNQNYPNPFNPVTKISYNLRSRAFVTLKVYDVLGNEVRTLVEGKQNAGENIVNFDGSGLATGVYFYKLSSDGISEIKKMILIK